MALSGNTYIRRWGEDKYPQCSHRTMHGGVTWFGGSLELGNCGDAVFSVTENDGSANWGIDKG